MICDDLSDSNSCALFAAFEHSHCGGDEHSHCGGDEHSHCGGDGDDGHDAADASAAFDEEGVCGKKFVVLKTGQSYECDCRSSSSPITIVCNTHLFSNNSGDSVRLIQVFYSGINIMAFATIERSYHRLE